MDLHGKIMNLPCDGATLDWANTREAFMYGHKQARHAAAELADEALTEAYASGRADERESWLPVLEALKCSVAAFDGDHIDEIESDYGFATAQRVAMARAAIAKATGGAA